MIQTNSGSDRAQGERDTAAGGFGAGAAVLWWRDVCLRLRATPGSSSSALKLRHSSLSPQGGKRIHKDSKEAAEA